MTYTEGQVVEVKDEFTGRWHPARIVHSIGGLPDRPTHYTVKFGDDTLGIFDAAHVRERAP